MTFVVTESCIRCKYTDCVDVCPAECFYEGENMLVINPEECIDCGICEPSCPVEAILPDSYPDATQWLDFNREYSGKWPKLLKSKPAPADADEFRAVPDKYAEYFSPAPATPT
jgi:ferredoxin